MRDNDRRKVLSKGLYAKFLTQVPLVIVTCGDKKASPDWYAMEVALAVENMILTAVSEGLSTCCVESFDGKEVKETIKAPENFEVLLLLAVCYVGEKLDLSSNLLNLVRSRKKVKRSCQRRNIWQPFSSTKS